jgi:hypothetical protein
VVIGSKEVAIHKGAKKGEGWVPAGHAQMGLGRSGMGVGETQGSNECDWWVEGREKLNVGDNLAFSIPVKLVRKNFSDNS